MDVNVNGISSGVSTVGNMPEGREASSESASPLPVTTSTLSTATCTSSRRDPGEPGGVSHEPVKDRSFLNDPIFVNGAAIDPNVHSFGRGNLIYSNMTIVQSDDFGCSPTTAPSSSKTFVFGRKVVVVEGDREVRCDGNTIIVNSNTRDNRS